MVAPLVDSVPVIEFTQPAGKDGFLATNSLMSFVWLLGRSYASLGGTPFPNSLDDLLGVGLPTAPTIPDLRTQLYPLTERDHLLVIFDPACAAVAMDVESRFSEAALGSVQVCDLRNFAHGRHHWIAKYGESSAVLGISRPSSFDLTSRTLELLPKSTPRLHLPLSSDPIVALPAGIVASMYLAGWKGETRRIDPGRPGVPLFGRRIYNLTKATTGNRSLTTGQRAIERKAGTSWATLQAAGTTAHWERHLSDFSNRLKAAKLKAIVFDYDGTLVSQRDKSLPPRKSLATIVNDLMSHGMIVGIATGRGGSVRRDLQQVLSADVWPRVLIGYHNGAEVSTLDDDSIPRKTKASPAIADCLSLLTKDKTFSSRVDLDVTDHQIGVQWKKQAFGMSLWQYLAPVIHDLKTMGLKAFASGHSVDIVESMVSKLSVVSEVRVQHNLDQEEILCVGDRGLWPGNDAELLSHKLSLSVDEVSADVGTCWRLTPPMMMGPPGTAWYLSKFVWRSGTLRLKTGGLGL